jgi:uncharacterized membrane protein (DUF441 family)
MKGKVNWLLVIGLSSLALIRPLMSMLGLLERIGQPMASITVTIIISIVWIAVVLQFRVDHPLKTLLYTGIAYGIWAIVISAIVSPILTGQLQGPVTNPFAMVSVILTNAIWGLITGWIATVVQRART